MVSDSRRTARQCGGSIILATHGTRVVGVAVDEVMDVQAITEEPIGTNGDEAPWESVRGLGHPDDGVVILANIHALVAGPALGGTE